MLTSAPDATKLLRAWMEWETGEATPGRVMANLKTAGMRDLLESLARQLELAQLAQPTEPRSGYPG